MKTTNTCVGCGRLLGLLSPAECPCWRTMLEGAVVPHRIRSLARRVQLLYRMMSKAESPSDLAAARVVARKVNTSLREAAI